MKNYRSVFVSTSYKIDRTQFVAFPVNYTTIDEIVHDIFQENLLSDCGYQKNPAKSWNILPHAFVLWCTVCLSWVSHWITRNRQCFHLVVWSIPLDELSLCHVLLLLWMWLSIQNSQVFRLCPLHFFKFGWTQINFFPRPGKFLLFPAHTDWQFAIAIK